MEDMSSIGSSLSSIARHNSVSHTQLVESVADVRDIQKKIGNSPVKNDIHSVMIVTKARDNNLVYLTRELAEFILTIKDDIIVYVDGKLQASRRFNSIPDKHRIHYWTPELVSESPQLFDLVITLGGDGTVLYVSSLFQTTVPPVMSFSLGSLGFLTNFSFDEYKPSLLNIINSDEGVKLNVRTRFSCKVYASGRLVESHNVINEVVIDRGPNMFLSMLELYGDNNLLTLVQADGLILSTPTGSTAYSLSAGGSLVHPEIQAISVTPICPHTLSFRPMLLPDSMQLRVAVPMNSRSCAFAAFDGRHRIQLTNGDYVVITASKYPFPTVMNHETEYIDSVSRKLMWNVRDTQKAFTTTPSDEDGEEIWDIDDDDDLPSLTTSGLSSPSSMTSLAVNNHCYFGGSSNKGVIPPPPLTRLHKSKERK